MAAKLNTTIRRWCETCGRFTRSALDDESYEICAEHDDPDPGLTALQRLAGEG
jgi:hypothetical protein